MYGDRPVALRHCYASRYNVITVSVFAYYLTIILHVIMTGLCIGIGNYYYTCSINNR